MLNKYPLWKYLLIVFVLLVGLFYAAPNLYAPDPALQVTGESSTQVISQGQIDNALEALDEAGIAHFDTALDENGRTVLIRLRDQEQQLLAQSVVKRAFGDGFIVALNLAPTTPAWLSDFGGVPMKLGLDLSGGVHFMLEVDVDAVVQRRMESYTIAITRALREAGIRGLIDLNENNQIVGRFRTEELREGGREVMAETEPRLMLDRVDEENSFDVVATMPEGLIREISEYAVQQNITTLRNRVNELGVSEPLVQRQGQNRIVVQLPGIQDAAEAKRILGKVANLEFRLVATFDAPAAEKQRFEYRSPDRAGATEWLERDIIITGENVANAQASFDQNGQPNVNIRLDGDGATLMSKATAPNIKRRMGVLFIERKFRTRIEQQEDGTEVEIQVPIDEKKLLTAPVIQSALGASFQITGLDSPLEASELALMLRAGALAAPISFVEERTVGPSLGAENIRKGVVSVQYGLAMVVLFMIVMYRLFGITAVVALTVNLVLLIAMMSLIGATLTLPGIAGIVLTVGMAVDANVLIFSRIREEVNKGTAPQMAIHAGYERAVATILDANITTLIVAVILYAVGTGPVKGFAVTLSIGILTSMFTAIMGTRAIINLIYGGRKVTKLSIGGIKV
ncbi:MAG: protein translocase subunit SecD [Pseudomonadota bacterium]